MTARAKRLGFVTTSFPRFSGDYAGNFVFHMAEAFARRGYKIDVVVPDAPETAIDCINTTWLQVHRVRYMVPRAWQTLCFGDGTPENVARFSLNALLIPPLIHGMWQTIERLSPGWDGIVSHWLLPSALISPRIPHLRIPHLAVAHSGDVHLLKKMPGKSILSAAILRRCTAINFVSSQLRAEFEACLPRWRRHSQTVPLHVTPMGIAANECIATREEVRRELGWRGFTVLYVGRLSPIKGVADLVKAMSQCDAQLVIAGDGELRSALQRQAAGSGNKIQFAGTVSQRRRDQLLVAADVLVVPSVQMPNGRHEGCPTIIAEAMAAGLPVVATKTGGIPEKITDRQNGLLVPENNPEAISKAINFIIDNPEYSRKISDAARQSVAILRWELLISRFEDMLYK